MGKFIHILPILCFGCANVDSDANDPEFSNNAKKFIAEMDKNGDGRVSFLEFRESNDKKNGFSIPDRDMEFYFNAYDFNKDGNITYSDIIDKCKHQRSSLGNDDAIGRNLVPVPQYLIPGCARG